MKGTALFLSATFINAILGSVAVVGPCQSFHAFAERLVHITLGVPNCVQSVAATSKKC